MSRDGRQAYKLKVSQGQVDLAVQASPRNPSVISDSAIHFLHTARLRLLFQLLSRQWWTAAVAPVSVAHTVSTASATDPCYVVDNSEHSPSAKATTDHVEQIHTNEKVPGNPNYYEKGGLRTYGDGEDHDREPPMTFKRIMSLIAMAFCKSQNPAHIMCAIVLC